MIFTTPKKLEKDQSAPKLDKGRNRNSRFGRKQKDRSQEEPKVDPNDEPRAQVFEGEVLDEEEYLDYEKNKAKYEEQTRHSDGSAKTEQEMLVEMLAKQREAEQELFDKYRDAFRGEDSDQKRLAAKRRYGHVMAAACAVPLLGGVSGSSVAQSLGMFTAMYVLSPNFRKTIGDLSGKLEEGIAARIGMQGQLDANVDNYFRNGKVPDKARNWDAYMQTVKFSDEGDFDLENYKTAAIAQVALQHHMYEELNAGGADYRVVLSEYEKAQAALKKRCEASGLDPVKVSSATRSLMAAQLTTGKAPSQMYHHLAFGNIHLNQDGKFVDLTGREASDQDLFEISWQIPDSDYFESNIGANLESQMMLFATRQGLKTAQRGFEPELQADDYAHHLEGYLRAWDNVKHQTSDPELVEQERIIARQMDTMSINGIDPSEQQRIFFNAYVNAADEMSATNPSLAKGWSMVQAKYGMAPSQPEYESEENMASQSQDEPAMTQDNDVEFEV